MAENLFMHVCTYAIVCLTVRSPRQHVFLNMLYFKVMIFQDSLSLGIEIL